MAIYHLNTSIIQRSQGRSVVAAAAYRRAERVFDERINKSHDYTNKKDVVHSEISIHQHAPRWAKELVKLHAVDKVQATEKLWNLVEASEKRIDSQLAREIKFALPIELTQEQNIVLAREFIQDQLAGRGMIADWSVHYDEGNPHVHVLLTMRELTIEGFGQKVRAWNSKILLSTLREQWSEYANFHLSMAHQDVRIDHRSYKEQGIDLVPGIHLGKAVCDMERRGVRTDIMKEANAIAQENLERIVAKPEVVLNKLTSQQSTFTTRQVGQELGRYINDQGKFSAHSNAMLAETTLKNFDALADNIKKQGALTSEDIGRILYAIQAHESVFSVRTLAQAVEPFTKNAESFAEALLQVRASPELIHLGVGDDGRDRFTTQKMLDTENHLQYLVGKLSGKKHQGISLHKIRGALARYEKQENKTLTEEQHAAVKHLVAADSISCLVGRAGTGKSFSLGAAKAVWESQGLEVRGIALAAIAAGGLAREAHFESQTIASFLQSVKSGYVALHKKSVLVMDEAGMTDSVSMRDVVSLVEQAGAKLVLVGDAQQLQPVGPGAAFRVLAEHIGFVELEKVQRQRIEWQRQATQLFAAGKVGPALALYHQPPDKGESCIHFEKDEPTAMNKLINDWSVAYLEELAQSLIISFKRDDVKLLNEKARTVLVQHGDLAPGHRISAVDGAIPIAKNDRLLFLKNDKKLGIDNGDFGTIRDVKFTESGKILSFTVQLDKHAHKITTINPVEYNHFSHGYAATIHKVQGINRDKVFGYFGNYNDKHSAYVQMSRHRENFKGYAAQTVHKDLAALTKSLNKYGLKDSVLDFPLAFSQRRNIEVNPTTLHEKLKNRLGKIKDRLVDHVEQILNPERYTERCIVQAEKILAQEQVQQERENAKDVAAYVDANRQVNMDWQAVQEKLATLGIVKMRYEPEERAILEATKEYRVVQKSLQKRDELAATITKNLHFYTKALEIYQLDLQKLQQQGQTHEYREQIKTYQTLNSQGNTVLRDRLAARLQSDIKNYYPHLKAAAVNVAALKSHAIAHLRRQTLRGLTAEERSAFDVVEQYQVMSKAVGIGFSSSEKQSHQQSQRLAAALAARDELAYTIFQDSIIHSKALDFYQIGLAVPRFNQPLRENEQRQAEARWYKLQQAAAQHGIRQRIKDYQQAVFVHDLSARLKLAHEIVNNAKGHHGAIVRLGGQTQEIWQTIRQDAKRYALNENFKKLDLIERVGFQTVQAYVDTKHANAMAWREIFESKKALELDDNTFYAQLAGYAKRYSIERNQLADKILANPTLHQAGLDYFKINGNDLSPQAHAHQCRLHVERYLAEQHLFKRSQYALTIIQDPKAHHGLIIENKLEWCTLYREARMAERQQQFAHLTHEEKVLQRLTSRYKTANRLAGQRFAKFKEQPQSIPRNTRLNHTLNHLFAKRDYLASKLLQQLQITLPESGPLAVWTDKQRLNFNKVQQQNAKHQERVVTLKNWHLIQQKALTSMKEAFAAPDNLILIKQGQTALRQAQRLHQDLRLEKSTASYHYALKSARLSPTALVITAISDKLQVHLGELAKPLQAELTQQTLPVTESSAIIAPRLNIANAQVQKTSFERVDLVQLNEALTARTQEVALRYLGSPKKQTDKTLFYGRKNGSLIVTLSGRHAGRWKDWASGEGGNILNLIQYALQIQDFKEVIKEAQLFLGDSSFYQSTIEDKAKIAQAARAEDLKRAEHVAMIIRDAQPIQGTLAERYLRETRGIQVELNHQTFQFHPQLKNWVTGTTHPALLVFARDAQENVIGLQAIFLNKQAEKAGLGHQTKLSRGTISGGALVHQGKKEGVIALAEGPETALSVAQAQPDWTVYTTYGVSNFASVALKTGASHIIICTDNDGEKSSTTKSVQETVKKLNDVDIYVEVVIPEKPADQEKWDFNDALKNEGADKVKVAIDEALKRDYPNSYIQKGYAAFKKIIAVEEQLPFEEQMRLATERIAGRLQTKDTVSPEIDSDLEQDMED